VDWKRFYRDELASAAGRDAVAAALAQHAAGEDRLVSALRHGDIVSFPHTTLRDSADPIARVAQSVLAAGSSRVVALGVLHAGTLPEPWRSRVAEFHRGLGDRADVFRDLGGAFLDDGPATTPHGEIPEGAAPETGPLVRAHAGLLANEFSLDLFLCVLAAAARLRSAQPPPVTRLFVSMTRDGAGSFDAAANVAHAVSGLLGDGVACVATGDLVHFGNSYTPAAETAALAPDRAALEAHFLPRVEEMFAASLGRGDQAAAYVLGSELRSDQRSVLPVLAEILGPGARADVRSFRLTDYASINGVAPPCFVASALVVCERAGGSSP
jgi:hypothetical protein